MKHSRAEQILIELVVAGESFLLVGSPGVGKTMLVEAVVRKINAAGKETDLLISHPVVSDPTDYKGLPASGTDADGNVVANFLPYADLRQMLTAEKPTLVFFDDIGQSTPAVQAALMQLVLQREINGHKISEHVTFCGATNRRQDKAAVTGLITPLMDRFLTAIHIDFDVDDWSKWAIQNNIPPVLVAFVRFKPDELSKFEPPKDLKKTATPRSIAGLGRMIKMGINEVEAWEGAVGQGYATEFVAFERTWRSLPSREDIYLNPEGTPMPDANKQPDVMYALMGMLAHYANKDNMDQTVRFINREDCPEEFSVLCMKDAIAREPKLQKTQAFVKWALDKAEVFGFDE